MKRIALAVSALLLAGSVAAAALSSNTVGLTGTAGAAATILDVALPASR
jgi:hypothetical protein